MPDTAVAGTEGTGSCEMKERLVVVTYGCQMNGKVSLITGRKTSNLTGCTSVYNQILKGVVP